MYLLLQKPKWLLKPWPWLLRNHEFDTCSSMAASPSMARFVLTMPSAVMPSIHTESTRKL